MNKKIEARFDILRFLLALVLGLLVAFVIIILVSNQPLDAIYKLIVSPMTKTRYFGDVIERMIPLMFCGLAVSMLFRVKMFNMASEGAFYIGGLFAAYIASMMTLPIGVHPLVALLVGLMFGAIVTFIPGYLKVKFGSSELVSSLMLNYVCYKFGDYFLKTFMKDPKSTHVVSFKFKDSALLPKLVEDVHIGIIIVIILITICYLLLFKTRWGYGFRVIGENREFAKYSGVPIVKTLLASQILGGMIAGIGGASHVLGASKVFNFGWQPGYGWDGLIVALIAKNNPIFVPVGAFILAYLRVGSEIMSRSTAVQSEVVSIIQGVIIILVVSAGFLKNFQKKVVIKEAQKELDLSKEVEK